MRLSLLTLAALAAGPAVAQVEAFQGDWATGNPDACVPGADGADFALRIAGDTMFGIESACRLTNPVAVRDLSAVLFDAECSGEGETWRDRRLLMIDADGALVYLREGYAQVLPRCRAMAAAAPVK